MTVLDQHQRSSGADAPQERPGSQGGGTQNLPNDDWSLPSSTENVMMIDYALKYASLGWKIFPVSPGGKTPLISKEKGGKGFLDATDDHEQIEKWWTDYPDANIGLATGKVSGVWVLDFDLYKDPGADTVVEFEKTYGKLPDTYVQKSARSGLHYFFHYNGSRVKSCSSQIFPNVDIRGDGGFVVLAPSTFEGKPYAMERGTPKDVAPAPTKLAEAVREVSESSPQPNHQGSPKNFTGTTSYGLAALLDEIRKLLTTTEGHRNETLNKSAYALGQLIAGGELDEFEATAMLTIAAQKIGLETREIPATIKSGVDSGKREPRSTQQASGNNSLDSLDSFKPKVHPWPNLDEKALHGIAGKVVEIATRNSEADPAAVLVTFLVGVAVEIDSYPTMMVGDTEHYIRLNAVIVGDSSKARKGTSLKPVERIMKSHNDQDYAAARITPGPLSSGEGIVFAVRDEMREWKLIDKITNEYGWVVTDPGVDDKRLFVTDEEFGSALSCTKREGNTLSTIIRQAWDHGNIEPLTKGSRIKATGAHVGILTHITSAELQKKMHETEALNGFANRFLWVCARRNGLVSRPQSMPDDEVIELHKKVIERVKATKEEGFSNIKFSEAAWSRWDEVYPDLSRDHQGMAGVVVNRAEAQVIRLSMLYAVLDGKNEVDTCHLEAALAVWSYCQDSALFIFGDRDNDTITDRIAAALQQRDYSATEINDLLHHNVPASRIKASLQALISQGKVSVDKKQGESKKPLKMFHWNEKNELNEFNPSPEGKISSSSLNSSDQEAEDEYDHEDF